MNCKYSWQQVCLHWLSAAVIIWATLTGFYLFLFHPSSAVKAWISFVNVSLTTAFIPFFILRIIYCYLHGKPAANPAQARTEKIAHWVHMFLYANISLVLVTGVLMMEHSINVFNFMLIPAPLSNPLHTTFFHTVHLFSCASLALLVLLHILAVIKHQLSGQGIMRRMSL